MNVAGELELPVAREQLWARLADPRALEHALPTVDSVSLEDADTFTVLAAPATGLGVTPLALKVTVAERREPEHVVLRGHGQGGEYGVEFTIVIDLRDAGGCHVSWQAEALVTGVLSSLGQRVLPAIVSAQLERVLRAAAESSSAPAAA